MEKVIIAIHILACLALVSVILLQRSEGGALGIGSGGGNNLISGRGAASAMTRITYVFVTIFFMTSLALTVLNSVNQKHKSLVDRIEAPVSAPIAPAPLTIPGPAPLTTDGVLTPSATTTSPVVPPVEAPTAVVASPAPTPAPAAATEAAAKPVAPKPAAPKPVVKPTVPPPSAAPVTTAPAPAPAASGPSGPTP